MASDPLTIRRLWANAITILLAFSLVGHREGTVHATGNGSPVADRAWNPRAAAQYLDSREDWWQRWDHAKRDHDTRCVSCHTQAPYALARPMLRRDLGELSLSPGEKSMLADVEKRVRNWDQMLPFYSDEKYGEGKEIESRNAESVLNAIILASYDAGKDRLSDLTRTAFDHAWALQSKTGSDAGGWVWQNFAYTPWESKESQYHWAALMAMTVSRTPGAYCKDPMIAANLLLLHNFLKRHYAAQPLLNKIVLLWASAADRGLLSGPQKKELAAELAQRQHTDGGWSTTDLGMWERRDKTPLETRSDGYATGLIVLALEQTADEGSRAGGMTSPMVKRGIDWLVANQDELTGSWPAWSLNKNRDLKSDAGLFMTDAATGYSVLALENAPR
jgi:squalene-hopene/tetraprenyl-beta-curcumene cyclase